MAMEAPVVNGFADDFNSVIIKIGPRRYLGFKSLNFADELKPGIVRGTSPMKRGRTVGTVENTASGEMYLREFNELISALVATNPTLGYGMIEFNINVAYAPPGQKVIQVELRQCRITKASDDGSEGEAALTTKIDLDVMEIVRNGISIYKRAA